MNFKLWLEGSGGPPVVFLDLDGTLVSTHRTPPNPRNADLMRSLGGVPVRGSHISFLRPHAVEFVNKLKSVARVCVITAGSGGFQRDVVRALGIPVDGPDVFGLEDYDLTVRRPSENGLPKSGNSVLVDDLDHDEPKTMEKLHAIGIDEDRHVKVAPFAFDPVIAARFPGVFGGDDELLGVAPRVVGVLRL